MKNASYIIIIGLFIFSFSQSISAQSRAELENGNNKQSEKDYSLLLPVLTAFYHDFPGVNDISYATYITPADVYHISYNSGSKAKDIFYADLNDINDYTQVASGNYLTWDQLPLTVSNKLGTSFDRATLKEFYMLEKDGTNNYYSLRVDGDNRILVECSENGRVSSSLIYNVEKEIRKAEKREGRYYPYYKVSYGYNISDKHISDYLFGK